MDGVDVKKTSSENTSQSSRKRRGRRSIKNESTLMKSVFADFKLPVRTIPGVVAIVGQGDVGQLGFGPDVTELTGLRVHKLDRPVFDVACGGMHTVLLLCEENEHSTNPKIVTFGCNDDSALGRVTNDSCKEDVPGEVTYDIVMFGRPVSVSAGDSHTAVLTENGAVLCCGIFRDSAGKIGLISQFENQTELHCIYENKNDPAVKIASGNDHILILTATGMVYSCGSAEQGQLGRISEYFVAERGGRRGLSQFFKALPVTFRRVKENRKRNANTNAIVAELSSTLVQGDADSNNLIQNDSIAVAGVSRSNSSINTSIFNSSIFSSNRDGFLKLHSNNSVVIKDIAAGSYTSFAVDYDGNVYVWGLNNFGQCGVRHEKNFVDVSNIIDDDDEIDKNSQILYHPVLMRQLRFQGDFQIAAGLHHTMFLDKQQNRLYACGRAEYGRLGVPLASLKGEQSGLATLTWEVKQVSSLDEHKMCSIACGEVNSFCVTEDRVWSWGMGSCYQLGHGTDEDQHAPKAVSKITSKVEKVGAGGQHAVFLVVKKKN